MVPFAPTMLICLACSTPNPDAAVYCAHCGATLPRPAVATLPGEPLERTPAPSRPRIPTTATDEPLSDPVFPAPAPAPALSPVARPLRPGDVVDKKYEIESVLGEGGMGIVYLARDLNTDARVVVKAIRSELAHDPDLRERVRAEGRALAHIDHANVVRLNAVVPERDGLYLIMQFVDGQSLDKIIEEHVARRTPLAMGRVVSIFRQVVAGVGAAHDLGVVHRDIKPGNVLIRSKDGVAKVTDFGIAKTEDDAKAGKGKTRGIIGSLWYMAPEQVLGRRDLDKRVDIYALGILLYEMVTGRVPFDAPSDYDIMRMHVDAPLPSVLRLRPDAPAWLDPLLARACAKAREHRFASCNELLETLAEVAPEPARVTSLQPARAPVASVPSATAPAGPLPTATSLPATAPPPPHEPTADEALARHSSAPRPPVKPARWPWALGVVTVLGGVLAALYYATDLFDPPRPPQPKPVASVSARPTTSTPVAVVSSAPAAPTLASLEGKWISETGRHYTAVLAMGELEFRIVNPAEFGGQNYTQDEARFILSERAGQTGFAVEDRIRPQGPTGTSFAPASRSTCLVILKAVRSETLSAVVDTSGTNLRVDLVNVTPEVKNFVQQPRGTIVSCNNLGSAQTARTETRLTRQP